MKTSARFLAMLLAVVMIASAALSVSAFSDVTASVEHATAINVLTQLKVIGGYEDGTFKPENNITRAEMAKLVYVLSTTFQDAGAGTVKFNDVNAENWAKGYISWCAGKDIIGGYGNGNFGPNDNVTYDQALKMVCGALGYNEWDSALWPTDVRTKAIKELKLDTDIPETVKGSDMLTRAQVAQIMYNALNAPMKETKNVLKDAMVDGEAVKVYLPEPKTLAVDIWDCKNAEYEITAVTPNAKGDSITINGESETLEELGLEEYQGKVADLKGLWVNKLVQGKDADEVVLGISVKGSVEDNATVTFDTKALTINGVKYTVKNFDPEDTNKYVELCSDLDGTLLTLADNAPLFDEDGKITKEFKEQVLDKDNIVRVIDFKGEGKVDRIVIIPKTVYEVESVETESKVLTVTAKALNDANNELKAPAAEFTTEVKEGDVIVAAQLNNTVYAQVVAPITTYAKTFNTSTATLAEGGKVYLKYHKVAGVDTIALGEDALDETKPVQFWIYDGYVLKSDAVNTTSEYKVAILKEIIQSKEQEIDPLTKTKGYIYTAVLVIDGVETTVTLNSQEALKDGAAAVQKAADIWENYDAEPDVTTGKLDYNYTLLASYEEKDGLYTLYINQEYDSENYVMVEAGKAVSYNPTTGLYEIDDKTVILDDNSVIFYEYEDETEEAAGFKHLDKYTKANIPTGEWNDDETAITLLQNAYLAGNEEVGVYTLIAAFIDRAVTLDSTTPYVTDGRLILYAPAESSIVREAGKNYYTYVFMDNATLTTKDADTKVVASESTKTEAGYLYGWNGEKYVTIDAEAVALMNTFKPVEKIEIDDVKTIAGKNFVSDGEFFVVDETVTIWGLATEKYDSYKQLSFTELADMYKLVKDYNANNGNAADCTIDALCVYYKAADGTAVLSSIIVEIHTADEDGVVTSANDVIFTRFGTVEQ